MERRIDVWSPVSSRSVPDRWSPLGFSELIFGVISERTGLSMEHSRLTSELKALPEPRVLISELTVLTSELGVALTVCSNPAGLSVIVFLFLHVMSMGSSSYLCLACCNLPLRYCLWLASENLRRASSTGDLVTSARPAVRSKSHLCWSTRLEAHSLTSSA